MKTLFLFFLLSVAGLNAMSQCDKKVKWSGAKGEMYNIDGSLMDTKKDSIFLETGSQNISLRFQSDDHTLEATINEKACDWKEPFKNGKAVYHTTTAIDGQSSDATFTIEAKDGKIILWVEVAIRNERKFKIYLDKYEEIK